VHVCAKRLMCFSSSASQAGCLKHGLRAQPHATYCSVKGLCSTQGLHVHVGLAAASCLVQAIDWLKATTKASGASCEVVAQHDSHFINSLELAVRFGTVRRSSILATAVLTSAMGTCVTYRFDPRLCWLALCMLQQQRTVFGMRANAVSGAAEPTATSSFFFCRCLWCLKWTGFTLCCIYC
jgi:hypothetical protein